MKKIITTVAFFALTLGMSNAVLAQSYDHEVAKIEAKKFVKSHTKSLSLTSEQEIAMYKAEMMKLRMTASARNQESKNEINETFTAKLKTILDTKQYKAFLKSRK